MSTDQIKPDSAPAKAKPKPRPRSRSADAPLKPAPPAPRPSPPARNAQSAGAPAAGAQGETGARAAQPAGRFGFTGLLLAAPSWLVSFIFHVVLLMLLALITFTNHDLREEIFQTASIEKEEIEELQDFELEDQPIEIDQTTFDAVALDNVGMADFGDITAPQTALTGDVSAHEDPTAVDIGQLFGTDGIGMAQVGIGDGATSFFGVRTEGTHFMYVVDNSNSMHNGKFENAVYELGKSIDQLSETSFFYIIFYSDDAYPLFYPNTVPRWVRATPENKDKVRYWLDTVHRCLQTRGEGAMAHALKLRPDVLYLLGDGAFTDKAMQKTLELEGKVDVQIHTLGFNMKAEHAAGFQKIAKAFGGSFRSVQVAPEMKQLSKERNRPRNREPNGVWGLNLGKGKKKK